MKRTIVAFALLGLVAMGGQAFAVMGTADNVPAATLLLPYFEVDCSDPTGLTTLWSVNNASAAPTVAHVTVWSNKSVAVFDFDIYLTGYDVQTVNMRDVLCNGNLPVTGPDDALSNRGSFSGAHDTFGGTCAAAVGDAPAYDNPAVNPLSHFQALLSGQPSPINGLCGSAETENFVGYLTVDAASQCSVEFPFEDGYFGGATPVATNDNILWGDWFIVDQANAFAQGDSLVHIEAQDGFVGGANGYTFYGRYTNDEGLADNREPLGTTYAVRHLVGAAFTGGTDLLVWRDSTSSAATAFSCATPPAWEPLITRQILIFDEEENPVRPEDDDISGPPEERRREPFPEETQRVTLGSDGFPLPPGWEFGWLYLNLNLGDTSRVPSYAQDARTAQAYVSALYSAEGLYSIGLDAIPLDNATDPMTALIP